MRKIILSCFLFWHVAAHAQECKVLLKPISKTYKGDCKKGKANGEGVATGVDIYAGTFKKGWPDGKGIYTWSNGDKYEGEWVKGMKEGYGVLIKKGELVVKGYWKKNKYIGVYENPYEKLDKSQNISSFILKEVENEANILRFYVRENQNSVKDPSANIIVHRGNYTNVIKTRDYVELQNVSFPFKGKVYFGREYIEFEVFKKGMWEVKVDITTIQGL